jgi:hypothetical protein
MMRRQPWPISSGTAQSGTTEVALDGRGAVAWSVPIPTRMASELVADADGRWFLRTPDLIAAGDRRAILWQWEGPAQEPCLLDDGSLVVPLRDEIAALDPATGEARWSIAGQHVHAAPLLTGGVSVIRVRNHDSTLVVLDGDGMTRWEADVAGSVAPPVGRADGSVMLASERWVEAFDAGGAPRWRASVGGFDVPPDENRAFTTQPIDLDGQRVIVGADAYDWLGFLMLDPASRSASRWPADSRLTVAPQSPLALRRHPSPLALAVPFHATLRLIGLDGAAGSSSAIEIWTETLQRPPYACAIDPQGHVAVAYTESPELHDPYLWGDGAKEMRGRSGVALLEPDGRRRWTWDAPGPLGGFAIGAGGEILVTSEGRLWALT